MHATTAPLRIGLTGGIGSGKSTVSRALAQRGAAIVDTDGIARSLCEPGGAAIEAVREVFGADVIDFRGAMDRARMRARVFADRHAKHRLEAILHPLIGAEAEHQAAAAGASAAIVFDIPLLVESGRWLGRLDRVWVVDCPEATQIERVIARSGWDAPTVSAVIAQQATRQARRAHADAVLYNAQITVEELHAQVGDLWQESIGSSR